MGKNKKDMKDENILRKKMLKKIKKIKKKVKSLKLDNAILKEFPKLIKIRETKYIKISKTKNKKHHRRKNKNSTNLSSSLFDDDDDQNSPFKKRKYHQQDRCKTLEHNYYRPNFQPQQISCREANIFNFDSNSSLQQVPFQNNNTDLVGNSKKEFDSFKFLANCYLGDGLYGMFDIIFLHKYFEIN
nr:MAG: hypothetical protein [Porcellio scaber clopovirus]